MPQRISEQKYLRPLVSLYFISKCLKLLASKVLFFNAKTDLEIKGIPIYKIDLFRHAYQYGGVLREKQGECSCGINFTTIGMFKGKSIDSCFRQVLTI